MSIEPDTKDWTWVLQRRCPECGLDPSALDRDDVPRLIRENAAAWVGVLAGPDVVRRPSPRVWSALEYACHVRDVLRLYDDRLQLMLGSGDARFANWDQDATAVAQRYGEQEPGRVARELAASAEAVADRFATVSGHQWQRTGLRSDGASFTVDTFARYFLHDLVHHLHDVTPAPTPTP